MNIKIETTLVCAALISICFMAYGVSLMSTTDKCDCSIKYNGDPEGWYWNMNQTNGSLPIQETNLMIYQEISTQVESISVDGIELGVLNLSEYRIEADLNGTDVLVYDIMAGVYGPVVIETDNGWYDVVVQEDDIMLMVV